MELYEAVMTTRSMRRLTDDPPVTDEDIEHCLRAAAQAPSGGNVQPYHFIVLTEPDVRAAMADIYLRSWRRYRSALMASLPPFRSPEAEASYRRGVELSEHLAEHLAEVPSVVFCMASYRATLVDGEGPLDIGTLHASVFPAVQNFLLAARGPGARHHVDDGVPHPPRRGPATCSTCRSTSIPWRWCRSGGRSAASASARASRSRRSPTGTATG